MQTREKIVVLFIQTGWQTTFSPGGGPDVGCGGYLMARSLQCLYKRARMAFATCRRKIQARKLSGRQYTKGNDQAKRGTTGQTGTLSMNPAWRHAAKSNGDVPSGGESPEEEQIARHHLLTQNLYCSMNPCCTEPRIAVEDIIGAIVAKPKYKNIGHYHHH